eukprot:214894-Chlamydomonas_euryale.AAC.5
MPRGVGRFGKAKPKGRRLRPQTATLAQAAPGLRWRRPGAQPTCRPAKTLTVRLCLVGRGGRARTCADRPPSRPPPEQQRVGVRGQDCTRACALGTGLHAHSERRPPRVHRPARMQHCSMHAPA